MFVPKFRLRPLLALLSLVAGLSASMAAVGQSPVGASNLSGQSPSEILHEALNEAQSQGAAHVEDVTRSGSSVVTMVGDLSGDASQERLAEGPLVALQVVSIGNNVVYIKGGQYAMQGDLGLSAKTAASVQGHWVGVIKGEAPYNRIAESLSLADEVQHFLPTTSSATVGRVTTIRGHKVVPVTGLPPASVRGKARGRSTLFVSASSPHVPVAGYVILEKGRLRSNEVAAFTKWGVPPTLTSPSGALAYSQFAGT
jgi:hypothetical protein